MTFMLYSSITNCHLRLQKITYSLQKLFLDLSIRSLNPVLKCSFLIPFLAVCALVGCVMMGPRIGRFDKHGRVVPMPGHSVPLSALGGLVLIFGFFACNGTKQVKIIFQSFRVSVQQVFIVNPHTVDIYGKTCKIIVTA